MGYFLNSYKEILSTSVLGGHIGVENMKIFGHICVFPQYMVWRFVHTLKCIENEFK